MTSTTAGFRGNNAENRSYFGLFEMVNCVIHLTAHKTSLCNASRYRNMSLMQSSVMFQPLSLNSKNLTIDNGLNVSKITFRLDITVHATIFTAQFHITAHFSQCIFFLFQLTLSMTVANQIYSLENTRKNNGNVIVTLNSQSNLLIYQYRTSLALHNSFQRSPHCFCYTLSKPIQL